jgi:hypothetical protein
MIAVAENSFGLLANAPQVIVTGEKYDISVRATSLDMKEIDVECEYSIFRREKGVESYTKAIHQGRTKKSVILPDGLTPGNYRIEFSVLDKVKDFTTGIERIDTVKASADFTLFDPKAKTMDVTEDFIYTPSTEMDKEHPADIYFMAEHNDITLYWMVIAGDSLIDKGMKRVGNEMQHFRFDYKEEYGDGIALTLLYIKDYEVHTHTKTITLTRPDKELVMNWKTFRDKLSPGQKETWTLSIKDKNGNYIYNQLTGAFGPVRVLPSAAIGANEILVADSRCARVLRRPTVEIEITRDADLDGWKVNVRKAAQTKVKSAHKKGLIYVADKGAAITAITK